MDPNDTCLFPLFDKEYIQSLREYIKNAPEGGVYPPDPYRLVQKRVLIENTRNQPSGWIHGGDGLFTNDHFEPGMILGVYSGNITSKPPSVYGLQSFSDINRYIDGSPESKSDYGHALSYMNDLIWDSRKNNVIVKPGGIVITTKGIPPGEQLLMGYGPDYDWDHVKKASLLRTLDAVRVVLKETSSGAPGLLEDLASRVHYVHGLLWSALEESDDILIKDITSFQNKTYSIDSSNTLAVPASLPLDALSAFKTLSSIH